MGAKFKQIFQKSKICFCSVLKVRFLLTMEFSFISVLYLTLVCFPALLTVEPIAPINKLGGGEQWTVFSGCNLGVGSE